MSNQNERSILCERHIIGAETDKKKKRKKLTKEGRKEGKKTKMEEWKQD